MDLDPADCYSALAAHDARYDGRFYVGVTSTGIYCRPVCRVRLPRRGNCRFFEHAAAAEQAGFRPCLRCRPELAPQGRMAWSIHDASSALAEQAARWLDRPQAADDLADDGPLMARLAARLGISDRHLRRIFERQFGVSPLAYLQTRRLLCAKQLLSDSALSVTRIAALCGFASVRRFNAAFAQAYRMNPSALRRQTREGASPPEGRDVQVRLGWRPPYDVDALLGFFAERALPGVHWVGRHEGLPAMAATLCLPGPDGPRAGALLVRFDAPRNRVELTVPAALCDVLPELLWRVRGWLDLDADPLAIDALLGHAFPGGAGWRVPGTLDGFELAVRAILGQQVSVAAGCTLAARLVTHFGKPLGTPQALPVDRLFPDAATLARAEPDHLGRLGVTRQRQRAIQSLATAMADGHLRLDGGADVQATLQGLTALPGIGDWTAHYIAMRALRWGDAFPAADVALHKALGIPRGAQAAAQAEAHAAIWRPWRSYAVLRAWGGLHLNNNPEPGKQVATL